MNTRLPENEWANLTDDELDACANWEVWRENCRRSGQPVERGWLEMNPEERDRAKKRCPVAWFGCHRPAVFQAAIFGSQVISANGLKVNSAEFVELGIHWDSSDTEIIESFRDWLELERDRNPNAKYFKNKKRGGNKQSAISVLVSLAILKTEAAGISPEDAKDGLAELVKKSGTQSRFLPKYYREALRDAEDIFRPVLPKSRGGGS